MAVISLSDVRKVFRPGPVEAVAGLDLEVHAGEILTLLGPSGCGKTTVLRLIAGFETPDGGEIRIGGRTVAGSGGWVPPERRGVGMVFQDYALFPHLTVGRNVMFGLGHLPRGERRERAREALAVVDLQSHFERYPHELSGGQQQRVALARALAPEPVVVLLDEPFSNLDAHLRESVRDEVVGILRDAGITCVFVSHDQRDALAISDRVAVMNEGRVEQVGAPRAVYKHPESVFVATFVGRTNLLRGRVHGARGCVLTDFGSFCRVDRAGLADGTGVLVAVRPEGFEAAEHGELRGRIRSTIYTGAVLEAEVEVPTLEGELRTLVAHLPPHGEHAPDQEVRLRIVSDYASVVRNGRHEPVSTPDGPSRAPPEIAPADPDPAEELLTAPSPLAGR